MPEPRPVPIREIALAGAWFASLPPAFAEGLLAQGRLLELPDGHRIFARGDAADGFYGVLRGRVRFSTLKQAGNEPVLAIIEPPHWFGEIAVFDGSTRTHDAWSEGEALLIHVGQAQMRSLLASNPAWWADLGRLLTQKVRLTFSSLEEVTLLPPAPRVASRLLAIAGGYGAWTDRSKRRVQVSQEQLAAMLSLTRQTVNQALGELEADGAIRRLRGAVEIVDAARLAQFAAGR